MKIVHIASRFYPKKGGVEKHVFEVSQELVKLGYKVRVIHEADEGLKCVVFNQDGSFQKELVTNSQTNPANKLSYKLSIWKQMFQFYPILKSADVIQVHDVAWWLLPLWPFLGRKIFITFHGYEGSEPPTRRAILHRKLVEILSRGSICVGEFMKKWYKAKPDIVFYGGANIKSQPFMKKNRHKAVFLGRLSLDTGILTYLDFLNHTNKKIKLIIFGQGELQPKVEKLIRRQALPAQLRPWTDKVDQALAEVEYAFVSRYLAILEAMQAKRLVMAVYNNEIKYDYLKCHPQFKNMIVANSGFELAKKLDNLTNQQKQQMVEEAYTWAKKQTWEKIAKTYLRLWRKTLKLSNPKT